jgi:hypothetical protein
MMQEELDKLGWTAQELAVRAEADAGKVRLARRRRAQTSVTWQWIAGALRLGAWIQAASRLAKMKPDPRPKMNLSWNKTRIPVMSNTKLADMLQNRHPTSLTVRTEVSPQSQAWGYSLGSVYYIRKVHFRDTGMIKQIEEKVVNRLRQVTSAIKQDGTNQVNIIASTAEQQAAIEFAKAAAVRPQIVGQALQKISSDPAISRALFNVLETQNLIDGEAAITLIPKNSGVLGELVAAGQGAKGAAVK